MKRFDLMFRVNVRGTFLTSQTCIPHLLKSAAQSVDVVTNRYKAGVGSILDVLTAEAALENARAQEVQARADWFVTMAQFAHDIGAVDPQQESTKK